MTARPISEIAHPFKTAMTQEIRASEDDIQAYIDGYMSPLGKFVAERPQLQGEISRAILEAVDGM